MLNIYYIDKAKFAKLVAASRGSIYLHLADGSVCDLKRDAAFFALFRTLEAPADGFRISVANPADVPAFLQYMLEVAQPAA